MRMTREVMTPFGPVLFSPLRAGALEVGDMITNSTAVVGQAWRITALAHVGDRVRITHTGHNRIEEVDRNHPVLRAVGAGRSRSGGIR